MKWSKFRIVTLLEIGNLVFLVSRLIFNSLATHQCKIDSKYFVSSQIKIINYDLDRGTYK